MSNIATDFQRATAERILHIYRDLGHRRVLLADEVGLGKTFVAKEVINLVRQWHKDELYDDLFKVVYICSNANIAEQNIAKLGVDNSTKISESRLSMQHLYITLANKSNIENAKAGKMPESIIPLTPSTSFRFYSAQGTANERALMYEILRQLPEFSASEEGLGVFLSCGVKYWNELITYYQRKIKECGDEYLPDMRAKLQERLSAEIIDKVIECVLHGCNNTERALVINSLRRIFAEISIDMLDPDLVVMDEFQRFSSLLKRGNDEQSMLAGRFFDDSRSNTKILLLSATPYKPYSTLEELNMDGRDEHYQDFMNVMDFLFVSKDKAGDFRTIWQRYSESLKCTDVTELGPLVAAKREAEDALYKVMCRTERFNTGIIDDSHVEDVEVLPEDILSYAQCQKLLDYLSNQCPDIRLGHLPMEYVKSSPYLLSFMDKYELKKRIGIALQKSTIARNFKSGNLLLSRFAINNYRPISLAHGKLKYLHDLVFGAGQEKKSHLLLWIPASNPYYKAGGIFDSEEAKRFSKIILFSSWEMVPRMISVMMSYYAELYTFGVLKKQNKELRYFSQKKNRYGENRFRSDNILEYPCAALAALYSPEAYYGWKLCDIKKDVKAKVNQQLRENTSTQSLPKRYRGNAKHILTIMQLLDGELATVPEDLYQPTNAVDVMVDIAIASPAVCAYRQSHDREDARKVGQAIVSIFNKPESAAIIDLIYSKKSDEDYYESVLDYCAMGNLQSVLDEYSHTQHTTSLGTAIDEAILGTGRLEIDTHESIFGEDDKLSIHCHFAIPFIDKAVTDKAVARTSNVRKAFNSPFRPFILSTTSVGQEGLDFHLYARKIVHWNLPSNPVDLEQREGRINRFNCLAIRRNVAALFASAEYRSWDEIFAIARTALKGNNSDMVPYWCLPVNQLSPEQRSRLQFIERIVPLYPLSRDHYRYDKLIKVLSLYRMTLGQPRQEELLQLLKDMHLSDRQLHQLTINLCPFEKARTGLPAQSDNAPVP